MVFARGRILRSTWWLHYALPFVILGVLAAMADEASGFHAVVTDTDPYVQGCDTYSVGPVATLVILLTMVPWISALVCRLHDRGHSAWWLLWSLLPVPGCIVLFITAGCLPGSGYPNRYGPAPLPGRSGALPSAV